MICSMSAFSRSPRQRLRPSSSGGTTKLHGRPQLNPRRLLDPTGQQRLARDHQALDLRGALVELHDLRVAHQLLDRVGYSFMKPYPPYTCTASVVTCIPMSAANRLACADASVLRLPRPCSTGDSRT